MASLKGKVIAVTGAASGIGLATARLLASHGALLSLADVQEAPLAALATDLSSTFQPEILTTALDIRNRVQVEAWITRTTQHFGRPLDGAANLAGNIGRSIGTPVGAIRHITDDEFDFVMAVNVHGTLNCLRAELPAMKVGEGGCGGSSIVNAASIAAVVGVLNNGPYVAAKHAVVGLTKTAAKEEGGRAIRVNAIAP